MNLDKIKTIPIVQVAAQHLGLSVDKNNKLRCFNASAHKQGDLHPSLSLDISNNRFKCFSCGVSGSTIDLTMGYKSVDIKQAGRELEKTFFSEDVKEKEYSLHAIQGWNLDKKIFDELYDYGPYIKVRFRDPENRKDKLDLFFTKTSSGKFVKGRKCEPMLFNQQDVESRPGEKVLYVEGEACVNAMKSLGYLASTAGSATITHKTFTPEMILKLQNRDIIILPDADTPGLQLVTDMASLVNATVKTLRVVDIRPAWQSTFSEEMPEKADIKNFIEKYRVSHGDEGLKQSIDSMIVGAKPVEMPVIANNDNGSNPSGYFIKKVFIPQFVTEDVLKSHKLLYAQKQFHEYVDGYYKQIDTDNILEIAKTLLGTQSRNNRLNEVLTDVKLSVLLNEGKQLNARTEYINLQNGMLNWIEKKLLPHAPDYLSTVRINANYNPDAQCPHFMQFLCEVLEPDVIPLIQELIGYCLIQDTRFEKAFLLIGKGANGKGTFLGVLRFLLGPENVSDIPLQNLADRFSTVQLHGKLANIFTDISATAMKETGYFKAIVSGDRLTGERKHQDAFSFQPFARLIYSCNEIPRSYDRTYAFYRRWVLVPFNKTFAKNEIDRSLKSKLLEERDGILIWAVEGLHRLFRQQDFSMSESSNDLMNTYKVTNDNILQYVSDRCILGDNYHVDKVVFYDNYKDYCNENNLRAMSQRKLNSELLEKFTSVHEIRGGFSRKRTWKGIGLNEN